MYTLLVKKRFINILVAMLSLMHATYGVDWVGGDIDCADSNVNTPFNISGVNNVVGPVVIQATGGSTVTATITADAVLKSDDTTPGRLFISAEVGSNVVFDVQNNLVFRGSDNNVNPLLIAFFGPGLLTFNMADGKSVSFTSEPTSQGAQFYVIMETPGDGITTVFFNRASNPSSDNVEIVVGPKSYVTYLVDSANPDQATARATIAFNPNNANPEGLMILRIHDGGALVVEGQSVTVAEESCDAFTFDGFTIADVDLTTLRGQAASFIVNNFSSGAQSSFLRIINDNHTLTPFRVDPFCNNAFDDANGRRNGFVLGANGIMNVNPFSYLDYIATSTMQCPDQCPPADCVCGVEPEQVMKARNPSAFFVDGIADESSVAQINMAQSAIYFRAGADKCGNVDEAAGFVINPGDTVYEDVKTQGAGEIVFDVEGKLNVLGGTPNNSGLQVLSLAVTSTGCPVVIASEATDPVALYPQRTFERNDIDEYLRYNSAAFLINNIMTITNSSLIHTDENHKIYDRDNLGRSDLNSEPTYVGGEAFKIVCDDVVRPRPAIAFQSSILRFHTSAGFAGVDVQVPNGGTGVDNTSIFRYYNNGCAIDQSYGRTVIWGTSAGAVACDGTLVDRDAHLDVLQTTTQTGSSVHRLQFEVGDNDTCITEGITEPVKGKSVHTNFLGGSSNISIGTDLSNPLLPTPVTTPTVSINGVFFSFTSAGGSLAYPEASGTTGEGAIFVDQNGVFTVEPAFRLNIATMVVKSGNGIINLPTNQVFFDSRIGIAKWQVDLATDPVLVNPDESLSDFTFDWGAAKRDCTNWTPYEPEEVGGYCQCGNVTTENVTNLPTVQGEVTQFQVRRSRIGDQVPLLVQGGYIRELVFLTGYNTAEAPVAFVVVSDGGRVGLSTTHRNVDSLDASIKLGINGVTIVADGIGGTVTLNENVIIDNMCAFLPGPDFGSEGTAGVLTISSSTQAELRIKSTGVLDLSKFNTPNKAVRFAGNIRVLAEPGAQIIVGSNTEGQERGVLVFTDQSELNFDLVSDSQLIGRNTPELLQPLTVKVSGFGDIIFEEAATMLLPQQAFLAVQSTDTTIVPCAINTDINWILNGQATNFIGNDAEPGGAFQVGNPVDNGGTVAFTLTINGPGALFEINRQGFLGAAAGIGEKFSNTPPNDWLVGNLENVTRFTVNVTQGIFSHRQIFPGSDADLNASLIALGAAAGASVFSLNYDLVNAIIRGGGNVFRLLPDVEPLSFDLRKKAAQKAKDTTVTIQKGSNLFLDHFRSLSAYSKHIDEIQLRMQSGSNIVGADSNVKMKLNMAKSLDLGGRDILALDKWATEMYKNSAKLAKGMPRNARKGYVVAEPGRVVASTQDVEVVNASSEKLVIKTEDVDKLVTLLTGNTKKAITRAFTPTNPIVEDTATAQAGILQSKLHFDMRKNTTNTIGPVTSLAYFENITQKVTDDNSSTGYMQAFVSIMPVTENQSIMGYRRNVSELMRKPAYVITTNGRVISTGHERVQEVGAAGIKLHSITHNQMQLVEPSYTQVPNKTV